MIYTAPKSTNESRSRYNPWACTGHNVSDTHPHCNVHTNRYRIMR